jgi:DNA-binding beta-propeller fold protein YncE
LSIASREREQSARRLAIASGSSIYSTTVWVSAGGRVTIYDPTLVTAMRVFDEQDGIGPSPYAIAFNTIKHQAYVADTTTDQITVLGGW